jgi:hypothetical protein
LTVPLAQSETRRRRTRRSDAVERELVSFDVRTHTVGDDRIARVQATRDTSARS